MTSSGRTALTLTILLAVASLARAQSDPLASWNDGANKRAIVEFSEKNTNWEGAFRVPCLVRWPGVIATLR
jgi:hypothetical protein